MIGRGLFLLFFIAILAGLISLAMFETGAEAQPSGADDPLRPQRHFKVERPAQLTPAEALTIYENIAADMGRGYAASADPAAERYRTWRRYNTAPYNSATHGNRYVNNYANEVAAEPYARLEDGVSMPEGSILAKDSFTVTADTAVYAGALFMMEKLAKGTSPETADWRYYMIMPDGSFFGDSRGDNAQAVNFCHDCHEAVEDTDYLFHVPEGLRVQFFRN